MQMYSRNNKWGKMQRHNIKYLKLVTQARELSLQRKNVQFQIADLALKACTIKHGGRSGHLYTMSNFCDDAGLSRKSVSRWIQERKIFNTLQKEKNKTLLMPEIRKIRDILQRDKKQGTDGQSKYEDIERIEKASATVDDGVYRILLEQINRSNRVLGELYKYKFINYFPEDTGKLELILAKCVKELR